MANELVVRVLGINAAAAIAVLAVLALRKLARPRMGAQAAYALWLIVPATLSTGFLPPRTLLISASTPSGLSPAGLPNWFTLKAPPAAMHILDFFPAIVGVWLAGIGVFLILLVIGQRRALARFGSIIPDAANPRVARASNPSVGPALVGALRPRVVLPADFEARFDEREQAMILAHERTHLAMGHAFINVVVAVIRTVNWFNPLIHLAARCARVDQELACDAAVIGRFPGERQTYAQALLKTQLAFATLPLGCDWPVRSPSRLEERIQMLSRAAPGRARLLVSTGAVIVLTAGATLATWAAEPPKTKVLPTVITVHEAAALPETLSAPADNPQNSSSRTPTAVSTRDANETNVIVERRNAHAKPTPSEIGFNGYLWRATLDTLSFMPLASANPLGGVVTTDWYVNPSQPDERFKATVHILHARTRSDGLNLTVSKQTQNDAGAWLDAPVSDQTAIDIENAIVTRARQLRVSSLNGEG